MIILNLNAHTMGDILVESLIGIVIVFVALLLLVFAFLLVAKISKNASKKRMVKQQGPEKAALSSEIPASEIAAISLALHLYFDDVHDKESNVITIKRIERRYSPWNSKIYGLTNLNR